MTKEIEAAVLAERERCIAMCEGWLGTWQKSDPKYVSAQTWANDAVNDIIDAIRSKVPAPFTEMSIKHRCFMDGIDWQHHLGGDALGTELFPCEESLRERKTCLSGGCGVVEVEVRLIRWVEPQNLKYEEAPELPNGDRA